ncbi:MAG: hypothetical protein LBI67_03285 [Treponema sp.]|jgi:hypothetical protein|nr:hypothetical protein [Treponema sp.]
MELLILEICASFFLFLSIIRPVFKALWDLDGIVLLPVLSLGIIAGIFPAYGFRPECVPLFVFALYMCIINFGPVVSIFSQSYNDDYRDRGLLYTITSLAVFGIVLWTALYYSPPVDMVPYEKAGTLQLRDRGRNEDLWVRLYVSDAPADTARAAGPRPLLLLVPPVAGSVAVTDAVCTGLMERGFTVVSYSRPGFDSPALAESGEYRRLFLPQLISLANALGRGLTDMTANAAGRALEEGRKQDVEFLLGELFQNKTLQDMLPGTDRGCVFLAGYGAGGAALVTLSSAPEFVSRFTQVQGVIALESPLYGSVEGERPPPPPPHTDNPAAAFFYGVRGFFRNFVPRRVTGIGDVPRPQIPVMFVVSDRVSEERNGRYQTIAKVLSSARSPVLLASLSGAGPFDYSDSPKMYPVYSFLFRGKTGRIRPAPDYPVITAGLMANFAAFIMESGEFADRTAALPEKTPFFDVTLEPGGVWNLPDSRFILQP